MKVATKYEMCLFSHERPVKTPGIKFFLDEVVHVQRLMSADFKLLGMNVYVSGGGLPIGVPCDVMY